MKINYSRSKIMAWAIFVSTVLLTGFSIFMNLEGTASTIFVTGIPSAVGLYLGKNYNDRKWAEAVSKKTNKK